MARPYSISPTQRQPGAYYLATFRLASGVRTTKSLGTADKGRAMVLCANLVRLYTAGCKHMTDVPADVDAEAVRLYFGASKAQPVDLAAVDEVLDEGLYREAGAFAINTSRPITAESERIQSKAMMLLLDRARIRRELDGLTKLVQVHKTEAAEWRERHEKLSAATIVRQERNAARTPPIAEALELYKKAKANLNRDYAARIIAIANEFTRGLPETVRTLADVTTSQCSAWLNRKLEGYDPRHIRSARREYRKQLAALLNWSAREYGHPSPIAGVSTTKTTDIEEELQDIIWHSKEDIEAAIDAAPNEYWRAIISTLAYSGLRLTELVYLRVSDVALTASGGTISVSSVDDGAGGHHKLKSHNSRRTLDVHKKLLLPRLRAYIAKGHPGEFYFFAIPRATMRERERDVNGGLAERWVPSTLSTMLRGHPGGKRRKATLGILPDGMTARTLRHSFGSLLLRAGKNYAEVAAALGDTIEVVKRHYARLKAAEVKASF